MTTDHNTSSAPNELYSDLGGPVKRIAIQFDPFLFEDAARREVYKNMLASLDAGVQVSALIDAGREGDFQEWVSSFCHECEIIPVKVPSAEMGGSWMRDGFLCAMQAGTRKYLRPSTGKIGEQAQWLAQSDGTIVEPLDGVHLDGGDSLVGPDYRLVGINAVNLTMEMKGQPCTFLEAAARIAGIDGRSLHIAGYMVKDIPEKWQWLMSEFRYRMRKAVQRDGDTRSLTTISLPYLTTMLRIIMELLSALKDQEKLLQSWAHIDLVVAPTGEKRQDKDVLLVAEIKLSAHAKEDEKVAKDKLDALTTHLKSRGFEVQRNPTRYVEADQVCLGYNNVILQTNPRVVWLPQFAGTYAREDMENTKIWECLGFRVIGVPGCLAFANDEGAIRCLTNVVERG